MASTGSWDIAVYQECCRWPPVLCRSQAQGLQLWEHQPGPELGDLWKELPDNIFSSVDLFAEVMITSPLFLRTLLELSLGKHQQNTVDKTYLPSELKMPSATPTQNAPKQEHAARAVISGEIHNEETFLFWRSSADPFQRSRMSLYALHSFWFFVEAPNILLTY